ncbi:MAG: hypothetical protein MSC31_18745 [Solirubrobacteraceae bacterium MAG38_C4-C5]|nr:hypothetical protein [Candidatus Siliceabacter maunaloa]
MQHQTIPVGQFLLDVQNPRHEPVDSQRDAIVVLIGTERQKLVVLANDIAEYGLSPIDRMLVIRNGRNFTVVEGNRRLAAVKILANPDLAEDTVIESAIRRVARDADVPTEVDCAVAPSRDNAEHWMVLRHAGEAEGAGVVRWNAFATNRFSHKPGTQAARAIRFLEAVAAGFPDNEVISELSARVAEKRLTTLGRLVGDPNFRDRIGLMEEDGEMLFHFPASVLQDSLEHVLGDLAADVTVSRLKSKAQREEYLEGTPEPPQKARTGDAKPLSEAPSDKPSKPAKKSKPKKTRPHRPFHDVDLNDLGAKTQAILREFRRLDVDKMPHTAAILVRAILELAVDEFIRSKGMRYDQKFKKRVAACLQKVDPTNKDARFQALRTGLQDGTSPTPWRRSTRSSITRTTTPTERLSGALRTTWRSS